MDTIAETATSAEAVRTLIDQWVTATRAGKLDAIMACYSPGVRAFDAIMEIQFEGAEAYRKHWDMCLSHMQGEMTFEVHDLVVTAEGDVGFAHYLARCGARDKEGKEHTGWLRATICCARTDGRWQIVHEHFSAPFDPMTDKVISGSP